MIITILGSGTSGGVPMIGCHCEVCSSGDSRDKRLRTSILLQINNKNFVFDAGPDFRQQMLREKVDTLEAIIFTHPHRDHTAAITDPEHPRYGDGAEVRALAETDPEVGQVLTLAAKLEGLRRQWGVHAAGVIMSSPVMRMS